MIRLEFLLEEPSMENVLKTILPAILPPGYRLNEDYFLRPHSGKSHLKKSIPTKMRTFSNFHEKVILVILFDQHTNDCLALKKELIRLCEANGNCRFLVRIVCRELESWYLGDMEAIKAAYPSFKPEKYKNKSKFRNPDWCNAAEELGKILPQFQKREASNNIPLYFDLSRNASPSFNHFLSGLKRILEQQL